MMIVVLLLLDSVVVVTVLATVGGTVGVTLVALNELTSAVMTSPEGRVTRKLPDLTAASSLAIIVLMRSSVDWPFWGVIVKVTLMLPACVAKFRMQLLFVTFLTDCKKSRVNVSSKPIILL